MNTTNPFQLIQKFISTRDMALAGAVILIIVLLIVPLPAIVVDLLMATNIAIAIGMVLLAMYIPRPMDFSTFPTMLLFITLFRLGINIATSRLILIEGSAGKVVETFGNIILGGNYIVGVVIFLMILSIQFMVVNSGVSRIAEVSARFTLDAMPGKQLSIDADMNSGLIDEQEARRRRKEVEDEADFYGALDGATKFVNGDTKAAIIIMLVNILGGIATGILMHGMEITQALQTYALFTIGAGLATQVPALLISLSTGLVITRSTEAPLGELVFKQLGNFNALSISAIVMALLMLVPGIPKIPFLLVSSLLGVTSFLVHRFKTAEQQQAEAPQPSATPVEPETPEDMLEMVMVDPVELEIGYALISLIDDTAQDNLLRRITGLRRQIMSELGVILPIVRIRDNLRLQPSSYVVKIRGQEVGHGDLMIERLLAIPGTESKEDLKGIKTTEPAFGLPAYWITETERGRAELLGYTVVPPISVISTHLLELFRMHAPDLLTRQMVQQMLDQVKTKAPAAVQGIVPEMLSLGEVQAVLRNLLDERIPIRDLQGILEVLAANASATRDPNILSEAVRQSMATIISNQYRDENNCLHVFTLSPQLESKLRNALEARGNSFSFQIDANTAQTMLERIGEQMEKLAQLGFFPILLCPRELRLALRKMVEHSLPNLVVLAYSEIGPGTKVRAHGMVILEEGQGIPIKFAEAQRV